MEGCRSGSVKGPDRHLPFAPTGADGPPLLLGSEDLAPLSEQVRRRGHGGNQPTHTSTYRRGRRGGDPRSYKTIGRRLYIAVAPDSWKARHVAVSRRVAVTVPVRRGGLLSLVTPIPPATISFHATAIVHPADSPEMRSVLKELASLLPAERRVSARILEVIPEGCFVTYGVGVSLTQLRDPAAARARVPVTQERSAR